MTGVPRVPANMTQPLLVELCIPHETAAGNHTGRIFINGTTHHQGSPPKAFALVVPVSVTVWPIEIPDTDDAEAFSPFFNFYTNELSDWYPHLSETEVLSRWMPFLAHHRKRHDSLAVVLPISAAASGRILRTGIPATSIYLDAPRPLRDYKLLAATGAKWLNLFDVTVCAHLCHSISNVCHGAR